MFTQPWRPSSRPVPLPNARRRENSQSALEAFRWKHSVQLLIGVGGSMLVFLGPALWLLLENYSFFQMAGLKVAPAMVEHMEREVVWLSLFCLLAASFTLGYCFWMGQKIAAQATEPLVWVEPLLARAARGDFSSLRGTQDADSELHRVLDQYLFYFEEMKIRFDEDLRRLESIHIESLPPESQQILQTLINEKRRHSLKLVETSPESAATDSLHRAS